MEPAARLQFTLNRNLSTLASDWDTSFAADVAVALSCAASRIVVLSKVAGSAIVIVDFVFTPATDPTLPLASDLSAAFLAQIATPNSALVMSSTMAGVDVNSAVSQGNLPVCPDGTYAAVCTVNNPGKSSSSSMLLYVLIPVLVGGAMLLSALGYCIYKRIKAARNAAIAAATLKDYAKGAEMTGVMSPYGV